MFKRLAACIVWFQEISIPSTVGIFALDPRPPPLPSPPSRIPVTFQHGWFPPVGKIFPSKNAVTLYYYAKEYAPSGPRPPPSEFPLPSCGGRIWIFLELGIHHFHRDHKAPYLPPKVCITIIFDSFREDRNSQENWKQWLICKSFREQGALCMVSVTEMVN